jgi:predicted class III extradiol MEMO1 family dioxygenase
MWHNNVKILSTFAHYTTQWAWANVDGQGWRRIKDGAADGCANLFIMMNAAVANNRTVSVFIDSNNLITTAYLF